MPKYFTQLITLFSLFILSPTYAGNETYPLLKQNITSKSYALQKVSDYWSMSNITYSPSGNFFLVKGRPLVKINAQGDEVYSLQLKERYTHLPFTYYIATPKGLYDLSKKRPSLERFEQIVNDSKTRTLTVASFTEIYSQAYKDADVVVYGTPNFEDGIDKYRAYMWIKGGWVLFYLSYDAVELDADYDFGITVANYPAKHNRTVLLKDTHTGTYSADSYRLRDHETRLPEQRLKYPTRSKLKMMQYAKESVSERYRGIPVVYKGTAHYRLTVGGEHLFFREIAMKAIGKRVSTQMNWFVPPAPYQQKTSIGFLEFFPLSNMSSMGSGGVYILKRK